MPLIDGTNGDDSLGGTTGADTIRGFDGNDGIDGGEGNDSLLGGLGYDFITDGDGDDYLNPGDNPGDDDSFHDTVIVGFGDDTLDFGDIVDGHVWVRPGSFLNNVPLNVKINGNRDTGLIEQGASDSVRLRDVAKALATGGLRIEGSEQADVFDIRLTSGQWIEIATSTGNDIIEVKGDGQVRVTANTNAVPVVADLGAGTIQQDGQTDTIIGSIWELVGGQGADSLLGSAGDESFIGRGGNDSIDGADGFDRISYDHPDYTAGVDVNLFAGAATGTAFSTGFIHTLSNFEWVLGTGFDDTVSGDGNDNLLQGADGNDDLQGGGGNDTLEGGAGNDTLRGDSFVVPEDERAAIPGEIAVAPIGHDWLDGGAGDDTVEGEGGNDTLIGGTGDDTLTGGADADVFAFFVGDDTIRITDFEAGVDDLALGGLPGGFSIQDLLPLVSQDGADVVIASGTQEIRIENTLLSDLGADDVIFV